MDEAISCDDELNSFCDDFFDEFPKVLRRTMGRKALGWLYTGLFSLSMITVEEHLK